jgi:hypothetical protein
MFLREVQKENKVVSIRYLEILKIEEARSLNTPS